MKYLFRFEEHCGDVYSRLPSIHTRVSGILDWINSEISDGKCGAPDSQDGQDGQDGQDSDNDGARNDTDAPEQRIYSNKMELMNNIDSSEFFEYEEDNEIEEAREGRVQRPIIAEESDLDEPELELEPFNANWS